ncbi:nicotinate-nucleotide--dimethylbenzimidazole phosphoribosyltransferase [Chrysochromulina tobinii]|uniref:Nicotinate-nucleotide--dimethylbenzimidazole phosphoribosyltransferase n=1 Tax=Chrysochromulina tobinii TaxID=1460289 RepID=A0A0M0J488_9EUKA|nr:nicotinate-nucleotide--dimethylbenzimidazole phosphoribosyltransferase [Chrysochromulina tobinii]|eukprot:KOO21147.1 nicotinate-nucleotide--dimethylbenzimidazole phosphoribosyltransferase [Chrysochromulina sp. CCMP291]
MDSLAKPPGSLGLLEEWSLVLCRMQRTLSPVATPQSVIVFCADHGVKRCDPSISPFPQLVTCAVFRALAAGVSATGVLARAAGAALTVVDCGIDGVVDDVQPGSSSIRVRHAKLAKGTADMRTSPAMDEEGVEAALELGRACVREEVARRGARVIAIGEVGIGNTTSAAALLAALTGVAPCECCGRGTGLDDAGLRHKEAVVSVCCANHQSALEFAPTPSARAKEALRRLGGFELAAMAGAYIEAERAGVVAVVDGFISAVAALCAMATLQAALTLGSPAPLLEDSKLRAAWSLRSKVTLAMASLLLACVVVVRPRLPR